LFATGVVGVGFVGWEMNWVKRRKRKGKIGVDGDNEEG
jgi:hypothetical protein